MKDDELSDEERIKRVQDELEEVFNKTFPGDDRDPTTLPFRRRPLYYKLDAEKKVVPASLYEFGKLIENPTARIVGRDKFGPYVVSTVFLCIDHGFGGRSKFFETMIWSDKSSRTPGKFFDYQTRYETYSEALEGHETFCALVREGVLP